MASKACRRLVRTGACALRLPSVCVWVYVCVCPHLHRCALRNLSEDDDAALVIGPNLLAFLVHLDQGGRCGGTEGLQGTELERCDPQHVKVKNRR